jgi:superfamily II DNA/RNA helicase
MLQPVLKKMNIKALNEMQLAAIQAFKERKEVLLLSPTGSGKTLAFLLPIVEKMKKEAKGVQALVVAPSRELALQIEQVFKEMGTGFKVNCCYGGHKVKTEENNFNECPAILIGTPGRLAFHVRKQNFDPNTVKILVLDEFDKSLEFGFQNDLAFLLEKLENVEKKVLTSATQSIEIPAFVGVEKLFEVNFLEDKIPDKLKFKAIYSSENDKLEALVRLISSLGNKVMLVFCNHRDAVERISELLRRQEVVHDIFHGKMEQQDRERTLIKLRNGSNHLLISTDLASRGLDIPEVEYVIHYQLPTNESAFVHRNGRTARMHAKGTAYFILRHDEPLPSYLIEKPEIEELPEQTTLPALTEWETLYISGGKKEKINKFDIVGLLLQKGGLQKDELGKIEVLDHVSYAAIKRDKIRGLIKILKTEKLKKNPVKFDVAR